MKRPNYSTIQRNACRVVIFLLLFSLLRPMASAYSVLTHEEIIDLLWEQHLTPLLLEKYPGTTSDQLREAHAYAYGGCVIQDMGYYPYGKKQFSDLVHYTRSGDFVTALLNDAQDVNEYAFALGALSHYAADISGHPAVNRSVPVEFPELRKKYGSLVTYEENPQDHIRTEFGFDVAQVAKNRYAPQSYHDFIGFKVATPLLERAFRETYGIELRAIIPNLDRAISSYRHAISVTIPKLTEVALLAKDTNVKEKKDRAQRQFVYRLSRADYEREWGRDYQRPRAGQRFLAFVYKLIPKIGPFKVIDFKVPSTATEDLYVKSVDDTVHHYQRQLDALKNGPVTLANFNLDTSLVTLPGQYKLADRAYANLVHALAKTKFQNLSAGQKENILNFYSDFSVPLDTQKSTSKWKRLQRELIELKNAAPRTQVATK